MPATSPPQLVELDLAAAIRIGARPRRRRRSSAPVCASMRPASRQPSRRAPIPDRLAQVLANLLSNAVRYTPAGGVVTVRAERRPGDVLVSVANTGDGIPAEDLDRVFERFYRVEKSRDRARGGAGIGLAIVKQLVEGAGGRVGAESGDGQTRFWFSLPARGAGSGLRAAPIAIIPARIAAQADPLDRPQSLAEQARRRR